MGLQQITGNEIAAGSIAATDLASASITGDKIGATAINANNIVNATITTTQIASNTISNTNIQTGAIENYSRATGLLSGMRNRIINGAMVIDQRNAGANVTNVGSASTYTLDRWFYFASQASKFTVQQDAGAITPPAGFNDYLGVTSSSAYTVGSGEIFLLSQHIEGFNVADLGWGTAQAKTVCLSFQVYSSLTGTFGGSLRNDASDRSYPFTYTIPTTNTWTQISVTVAGDTSGTWLTTNGTGIRLAFGLGVGSTYSGTAGSWQAANYISATGATSVVGTSGATFYLTGVQLEVGSTATSFDYRPYGTELALCQRYFTYRGGQNVYESVGIGQAYETTNGNNVFVAFPVSMRTVPTFTVSSASNWAVQAANGDAKTCTAITFSSQSSNLNSHLDITVASGLTAGQALVLYANNTTSARLNFSAEL